MRNDFESDYLAHHGILGMKWGKKNGPPYPLGPSDHSQAEKKAGYKKSIGGGRNEELYDKKKQKKKQQNTNPESTKGESKKGLSDKQKKALKIGAAVAGTALVAYGGYKLAKSGELSRLGGKAADSLNRLSAKADSIADSAHIKAMERWENKTARLEGRANQLREGGHIEEANAIKKKLAHMPPPIQSNAAARGREAYVKEVEEKIKASIANDTNNSAKKAASNMAKSSGEAVKKQINNVVEKKQDATKVIADISKTAKSSTSKVVNKAQNVTKTVKDTASQAKPKLEFGGSSPKVNQYKTKLEFGKSTKKVTSSDIESLYTMANMMMNMASAGAKAASNNDSYNYAQDLLKKNKRTLKSYTMKDL